MRKKNLIGLAMVLAVAGIALAFYQRHHAGNRVAYRTSAVTRGDLESFIFTTGTLDPVTVVEVSTQVPGRVAQVVVDFNSPVKKGQVLAELEKAPFEDEVSQHEAGYRLAQAALEKARVLLETAKKEYDRQLDLYQRNLISAEDKDTAEELFRNAKDDADISQAGLKEAKSELDNSRVDLSNAVIRSPIDGVVISRNLEVGQAVTPRLEAPVLFRIADDLNKLRADCSVEEADVGKVRENQSVRFTVEAFPTETFTGRVIQVRYGPEASEGDVTYTAVVEVENPRAKLLPGMTATVFIITASAKNVLMVPDAALKFDPALSPKRKKGLSEKTGQDRAAGGNTGRVWVPGRRGKLKPVLIKIGISDDINSEVTEGDLKEKDLVVIGLESGV